MSRFVHTVDIASELRKDNCGHELTRSLPRERRTWLSKP